MSISDTPLWLFLINIVTFAILMYQAIALLGWVAGRQRDVLMIFCAVVLAVVSIGTVIWASSRATPEGTTPAREWYRHKLQCEAKYSHCLEHPVYRK